MPYFLGFMGGIFWSSFFYSNFWVLAGVGAVSSIIVGLIKLRKNSRPSIKKIMWVGLFLISFSVGAFRFEEFQADREDSTLKKELGSYISGKGIIIEEPDRRDASLRLVISIESIAGVEQRSFKNKILVVAPVYSDSNYGDEISFAGILIKPQNFVTDTGRTFDYIHYLEKDAIFFQLNKLKLEVIAHNKGNWLESALLKIKYSFLQKLSLVIPEPQLSLLGGLFLGTKQSLGSDLLAKFQKTGVIHMVVISGYNITIVAEAMSVLFSFFSFSLRVCFSAAGVILFVVMTGSSAASVRAALMALIALFGRLLGRKYDVVRALLFSAVCMVFYNPLILVFDPSFQLSFLATLALLTVSPVLAPRLTWLPHALGLRETFVATLSTQLFLLPFLLYLTGTFSVVSLPVNLLVLFPVPFTMLTGFVSGLLSFLTISLAFPFAFITNLLLSYILFIVETAANLWFAAVSVPLFPFWITALAYLFYTIILWKLHHPNATTK